MAYINEKRPTISIPEYLILSHRATGTTERYVNMTGLKRIVTHNTTYVSNGDSYVISHDVKIYKHIGSEYVLVFDADDNTDFSFRTSKELRTKLYNYLENI